MLQRNPRKRLSAAEAAKHPWIQRIPSDESPALLLENSLHNLKAFQVSHKVEKALFYYITYQILSSKEQDELTALFTSLDKNHDGQLSREELLEGYGQTGISTLELDRIMEVCDANHSGFIDFTEFLMAAQDWHKLIQEDVCTEAFRSCIIDGTEELDLAELKKCIQGIPSREWNRFLDAADSDGSGKITLNELQAYLLRSRQQN